MEFNISKRLRVGNDTDKIQFGNWTCNKPCYDYHRLPCVMSDTCGACVQGYSGKAYGNTICTGTGNILAFMIGSTALVLACVLALHYLRGSNGMSFQERFEQPLRAYLADSFIEGEWQCEICYHENHPDKPTCIMCGTKYQSMQTPKDDGSLADGNRPRAAKVLNKPLLIEDNVASPKMPLNARQAGARRRHLWKRRRCSDGQIRWIQANLDAIAGTPEAKGPLIQSNVNLSIPENEEFAPGTPKLAREKSGFVRTFAAKGEMSWQQADGSAISESVYDSKILGTSIKDIENIVALPFREKNKWFLRKIQRHSGNTSDGYAVLKISRESLLEDSVDQLLDIPVSELRDRFRIQFKDEPGIDAGGVVREWVLLVCKELFSTEMGLFTPTHASNVSYWINSASGVSNQKHLKYFSFFGRFIGKILLEGHVLPIHLALPFMKHILNSPICHFDLTFLDEDIHKSMQWIFDNENVDVLGLDFTVNGMELKPDGASIELNDKNKQEYLNLVLKYYMLDSINEQLAAFLNGLHEVISVGTLQIFDYQELDLLLCGIPDLDLIDWQKHTEIRYMLSPICIKAEDELIKWFWEVLESFSVEERARLLQFVTGTSRVPVEGFKGLTSSNGRVHWFNIQVIRRNNSTSGLFPRVHTCFNRLDLPLYESKSELFQYLSLAINMELTGFSTQ